jgi:hypothetical protein
VALPNFAALGQKEIHFTAHHSKEVLIKYFLFKWNNYICFFILFCQETHRHLSVLNSAQ